MKMFCNTHRAEFFELNPAAPNNIFQLGVDNPERIAVLEGAEYPMGYCAECYNLATENTKKIKEEKENKLKK